VHLRPDVARAGKFTDHYAADGHDRRGSEAACAASKAISVNKHTAWLFFSPTFFVAAVRA
jgi:hypothetical protein